MDFLIKWLEKWADRLEERKAKRFVREYTKKLNYDLDNITSDGSAMIMLLEHRIITVDRKVAAYLGHNTASRAAREELVKIMTMMITRVREHGEALHD